jgi:hypothetical protein
MQEISTETHDLSAKAMAHYYHRSPKNATPNPSTSRKFLYTPSNPRTYHAKKKDALKLSIPK